MSFNIFQHENRRGDITKCNTEIDYDDYFIKVSFKIDTDGFDNMCGYFKSDDKRKKFLEDTKRVCKENGLKYENEETNFICALYYGNLYFHPQAISGVVEKNYVEKIAQSIDDTESMTIRWVDLFETVYEMNDYEYDKYLESRKDDIMKMVFDNARTTRRNKFIYKYDIVRYVESKIGLERIDDKLFDVENETERYIEYVINEMVDEGYLIRYTDNTNGLNLDYIRSLNKTEQKSFVKKCNNPQVECVLML